MRGPPAVMMKNVMLRALAPTRDGRKRPLFQQKPMANCGYTYASVWCGAPSRAYRSTDIGDAGVDQTPMLADDIRSWTRFYQTQPTNFRGR